MQHVQSILLVLFKSFYFLLVFTFLLLFSSFLHLKTQHPKNRALSETTQRIITKFSRLFIRRICVKVANFMELCRQL